MTTILALVFGIISGVVFMYFFMGRKEDTLLLEQVKFSNSVIKDLQNRHDVIRDLCEKYIESLRQKGKILEWGADSLDRRRKTLGELGRRILLEVPEEYQAVIEKEMCLLFTQIREDYESFEKLMLENTKVQHTPEVKEIQTPVVSELHGCVAGDVVKKIVRALGPDLVKGMSVTSDEDFIYLEPVSSKEIEEVINLLKEKFGIEAWLNTANYRPTVCFSADALITK